MVRILKGIRIKGTGVIGKITGKISSKLNKVFGFKGRAPKPAPRNRTAQPVAGHRGISMISREYREARIAAGLPEYTLEEIAKWKQVSGDEVQAFIEDGMPLFVHSSNIVLAQYFKEEGKLMLEFKKSGSAYLYSNISVAEALSFAQAQSKGSWCWDNLRVRGSRTLHRKPYTRLRSKSTKPIPTKPHTPPAELPPL